MDLLRSACEAVTWGCYLTNLPFKGSVVSQKATPPLGQHYKSLKYFTTRSFDSNMSQEKHTFVGSPISSSDESVHKQKGTPDMEGIECYILTVGH